jgi:hypothetical protein
MFAVAGTKQIGQADAENVTGGIHANLTVAAVKEDELVVALDAGAAEAAGLVANLAKRNPARTDAAVVPEDVHAVVVGRDSSHDGIMPRSGGGGKRVWDAGYAICDGRHCRLRENCFILTVK